jgi:quinol monooxygenase YgiN
MAIFVTMEVGPIDWSKFQQALDWSKDKPAPGRVFSRIYRGEQDPNQVLIAEEWQSHDAMHAFQDQSGDEFNRLAGTEGMDWRVNAWQLAMSLE